MRLYWLLFLFSCLVLRAADPPAATAAAPVPSPAPADAERAAYDAGIRELDASLFSRAARTFAEFTVTYPSSVLKPDADLRREFSEAAAETNVVASADRLAAFARAYTNSPLAVNAVIRAGRVLLGMGQATAVLKLLNPTNQPLANAIATAERKPELVAAFQVRAEAALQVGQPAVAVAALEEAAPWASSAPLEVAYDRLRLLLQAQLAVGAPAAAITAGERLRALVESTALTNRRPEAISLLAGAVLKAGDTAGAATLYTNNLAVGTPLALLREATMQIAEFDRRAGRLSSARQRLDSFLNTQSSDPQLDRIRWALAQILFAQYEAARGNATNDTTLLVLAESHLASALTNTTPALRAGIQLLRGWCLWETAGNTNQLIAAADAFEEAAATLPKSPDQAVARFKVADARFRLGQPAVALTNYLGVAEGYLGVGEVDEKYGALAWQQAVAAAIATTNFPVAQRAMEQLLRKAPKAEATAEVRAARLNRLASNSRMPAS